MKSKDWLPINKKIWTSSFAIFMAGLDCMIYAVTAWLVDERGWRTPVKPLVTLGMNSIAVYVAAELLDTLLYMADVRDAIYETAFVPFASALLYACAYTLVMVGLAWVLYRRRIFIRV